MRPPFSTSRLDTKSDKFKRALLQCLVKLGTVGVGIFVSHALYPILPLLFRLYWVTFWQRFVATVFVGHFLGPPLGSVPCRVTCEVSKGNVGVMRSRDLKVITQSLVQIHKWMIMNVSCHILPEFHPHYIWLTVFWCCNLFTWWSVTLLHHVTPRNMNVAKSSVWFCVEVAW